MSEEQKIETITFQNETYKAEDLNEQAVQHFNILLKMQNELNEQQFQVSKTNIALETMQERFKELLDELKIEPITEEKPSIITQTKEIN